MELSMNMVTIEVAAQMMGVPVQWVNGMIDKGEIDSVDGPNGTHVDMEQIDANGWNVRNDLDVVSYGHVNTFMVNLGLRTLH